MILDAVEAGADGLRQLALLAFRSQLFAAHALIAPLSGMSLRLLETEWAKKFTEITRDNEDVNGVYLAITEYFQDTAKLWIEVVSFESGSSGTCTALQASRGILGCMMLPLFCRRTMPCGMMLVCPS